MNSDHRRTIRRGQLAFVLVAAIALALAGTANAANYVISGGGGQLHIGGGLALPIQPAFGGTGTTFPNLLIPVNGAQTVSGTTAMSIQQKLVVPAGVLKKAAAQTTVGVAPSNPTLFAVGTNLSYSWPVEQAVFSTGVRPLGTTTMGAPTNLTTYTGAGGNFAVYSNALAKPFGGAARFALSPGPTDGAFADAPVTIYAIGVPGPGNPPCTHTAFTPVPFPAPGNPACVAGLAQALPTGLAAPGASVGVTVNTPGGTPAAVANGGPRPGVAVVQADLTGNIGAFFLLPTVSSMTTDRTGFTNMASSTGFPFTAGKIKVSAPLAGGAPENFTLTGKDLRSAGGAGTIQMVAASVSQRTPESSSALGRRGPRGDCQQVSGARRAS